MNKVLTPDAKGHGASAPTGIEERSGQLQLEALAGPFSGKVEASRSYDSGIYITLDNGLRGWTVCDLRLNALAAAAEAAGRPVWVKYQYHDPNWGNNSGYFHGIRMALKPHSDM